MKAWLYLLVGVVVVVGMFFALSTLVGLLWWLGVGCVILFCVLGFLRSLAGERPPSQPVGKRHEKRVDRATDRALRDIEEKIGRR